MKQIILKRVEGFKQTVLANTLHRLCKVPIKTGNDFEDAKHFEEQLNIQIQIYGLESRQMYKSEENHTKVYILISDVYGVTSNLAGYTCANAEYSKCNACKSKAKCDINEPYFVCKSFYG